MPQSDLTSSTGSILTSLEADLGPAGLWFTPEAAEPGGPVALLSDRDANEVRAQLADLPGSVTLVNFTQELACEYCRDTERLLKEVAALSDKIRLAIYNFQLDKAPVTQYGVDKVPATVVLGAKDYGIRFYGIPLGYEFAAFLAGIKDVARGSTDLSPESRTALAEIVQPVHLEVFSTPT